MNNADLIRNEIKSKFILYLINHDYEIDINSSYDEAVICFFNYIEKRIPIKKYKVTFSQELLSKFSSLDSDKLTTIRAFKEDFEKGNNMNCHLSKYIYKTKADSLLLNWNIKHIHLNMRIASSKIDMSNNRSDTYLLVMVDERNSKIYFLDVVPHLSGDDFADINFLWILFNNNWLEAAGFSRMEQCLSASYKIETKSDLMNAWKNHINYSVFEFNGSYYFNFGNGMTLHGNSLASQQRLIILNKYVDELVAKIGLNKIKDIQVKIEEKQGIPYYEIKVDY